jgi:hypothetical protein
VQKQRSSVRQVARLRVLLLALLLVVLVVLVLRPLLVLLLVRLQVFGIVNMRRILFIREVSRIVYSSEDISQSINWVYQGNFWFPFLL